MNVERLIAEKRRRLGFLAAAHDKQRAAILDEARFKAILTPRRAGKSTTCVIDFFHDQASHPGSQAMFLALTRPSAEAIVWPIVRQIDREFNAGCHFQEAKLRVTTKNDSQLICIGADQQDWAERLRGRKLRRVYVDEAAFYGRVDMGKLLDEIIGPSIMDECGSIYLVGTPGDIAEGFFYDVTMGKVGGWSVHKWSTLDNPYVREQYLAQLEAKRAAGVNIEKDPGVRREYFGEWVEDPKGLVYVGGRQIEKYVTDQAVDHPILAVDFGYKEDSTSFTLGIYSDAHPDFIIAESWKKKLLVPDIAEVIRQYEADHPGLYTCGDSASKIFIDELRQRFEITIADTPKSDKNHWIKLYNSDAAAGRIKIVRETCKDLIDEQRKLQKQVKYNGQWREWVGQPNDCCDSALYAYRHARHFMYAEPKHKPPAGSPEALENEVAEVWEEEANLFERKATRGGKWL